MKKIKYDEFTEYSWECPECETLNETHDDLKNKKTLTCEGCDAEFKNGGKEKQ